MNKKELDAITVAIETFPETCWPHSTALLREKGKRASSPFLFSEIVTANWNLIQLLATSFSKTVLNEETRELGFSHASVIFFWENHNPFSKNSLYAFGHVCSSEPQILHMSGAQLMLYTDAVGHTAGGR